MARGFEAITKVTIHASKRDVWNALTNPEKVKQYMHGTEMSTDWKEGSPIFWRGEWKGRPYEDKGTVLAVEPQKLLKYTHWRWAVARTSRRTTTPSLASWPGRMVRPLLHSDKTTTPPRKRRTRWLIRTGGRRWMDSRQSRRSRRSNDSTVYTPRRLSVTLSNAKAKASARLRAAGRP